MMKRNNLARIAALSGCAWLALASSSVSAQAATELPVADPESGPEDASVIVVTGSLIRRDGTEARAPMTIIDSEAIEKAGYSQLSDVARDLVANTGSVLVQDTGSLLGTAQFNLRGLGLGSTLTLINGRRAGIAPIADGGGNDFFDINQLPLSMIGRVDFLKDGASSTYGSQAVAGVANIITRKGFEGLELSGRFEDAVNQAGSISLASGIADERGSLNVYATYYRQSRADRSEFEFLVDRIGGGGDLNASVLTSATGQPGSYVAAVTNPVTGTISAANGNSTPDPNCVAAGGFLRGTRCRFDFFDQVSVLQGENRLQVFGEAEYEILNRLKFFGEAHFSRNRIERTSGPGLFQNGLVNNGAIFIPAEHPFNFYVSDPTAPAHIRYVDPADWNNAVNQAVDLVCLCRPLGEELNGKGNAEPRRVALDYWRAMGGLEYGFGDDWFASVAYQYSASERDESRDFNFIAERINQAALDGTWNPFGSAQATPTLVSPKSGVSVAANSQAVIDSLKTFERNQYTASQYTIDGLISGTAFELPGGDVGVAVGAQYRSEQFEFTPDSLMAAGQAESPNPVFGADGEQDVYSIFGEVVAPVIDRVEVQLAVRLEDYGSQGGKTVDPKVAVRVEATDWLALRGSYGTSFQAPTIRQLSRQASRQVFFDSASVDPGTGQLQCVNRGVQTSGELLLTSSPDLRPQTATNYNLGLVLTPSRLFSLTIDYFNYDYNDLISPDEGAQAIVENDCADDGIPNDPRIERTASGEIRRVTSFFINTGQVRTDGIDVALSSQVPLGDAFNLGFSGAASYILGFRVRNAPNAPVFDVVGSRNFRNQFPSLPRLRTNGSVALGFGQHNLIATVRHIAGYDNDQTDDQIRSHTTLDLQYNIELEELVGESTQLSVGANNIFDRDPPTLGNGIRPGYDEEVHDVRGRIIYVGLRQRF